MSLRTHVSKILLQKIGNNPIISKVGTSIPTTIITSTFNIIKAALTTTLATDF